MGRGSPGGVFTRSGEASPRSYRTLLTSVDHERLHLAMAGIHCAGCPTRRAGVPPVARPHHALPIRRGHRLGLRAVAVVDAVEVREPLHRAAPVELDRDHLVEETPPAI